MPPRGALLWLRHCPGGGRPRPLRAPFGATRRAPARVAVPARGRTRYPVWRCTGPL